MYKKVRLLIEDLSFDLTDPSGSGSYVVSFDEDELEPTLEDKSEVLTFQTSLDLSIFSSWTLDSDDFSEEELEDIEDDPDFEWELSGTYYFKLPIQILVAEGKVIDIKIKSDILNFNNFDALEIESQQNMDRRGAQQQIADSMPNRDYFISEIKDALKETIVIKH